ncbi:hypothetical protein PAAG_11525 [Paracoccidioides lutzii Pb01]|uniref:Uncharacterized protein n=1 Tax=Paracoccidioides lutzii (strain ATCC MYA-826 / Pb01) TaxID=502779 RepID=A0A0A2V6I1_PARBA|nr:hypothetical protein PAAG_11525 [Paracoccidioides lutzii Pb01]KGQ01680.1 hypothetical protein PAAG_11525 [Paracoccidioides lutzii Pb01]
MGAMFLLQLGCLLENIAESSSYAGAIADNDKLQRILNIQWAGSPVADLKTQIHRWIMKEKETTRTLTAEQIKMRQKYTIYIVSFTIWDIWRQFRRNMEASEKSVLRSVASISNRLSIIGDEWIESDMKMILLSATDVTFLPAFNFDSKALKLAAHLNV